MSRTAIVAAMPDELKPLVRGWRHEHRNQVHLWRHQFDGGEWVAACGGAGADAGTRAFTAIEADGPVDCAISVGWAGALQDKAFPGQVYLVAEVIDARTGERFPASEFEVPARIEGVRTHPGDKNKYVARVGYPGFRVVTSPVVAGEREKQRLAAAYQADLVDMEGAIVARLAQIRGIPFYCIKGVSDGFKDQLPDFNCFILPNGQFRLAAFILFAILRPWYWRALMRMGENSRKAAQAIAQLLLKTLNR